MQATHVPEAQTFFPLICVQSESATHVEHTFEEHLEAVANVHWELDAQPTQVPEEQTFFPLICEQSESATHVVHTFEEHLEAVANVH